MNGNSRTAANAIGTGTASEPGASTDPRTAVQQLARFAVDCRDRGLPPEVAADVTGRVLDVVGNCLAGRAEGGPAEAVLDTVRAMGGSPRASLFGEAGRLPAAQAALVNGTLAHTLDFDDTHLPSVLHPSASVVPAALAAAEETGASGARLAAAVAAGIEICNRLGMASYVPGIRNSLFFEKGQHATSICGTLGAAAAVALLYGLDEQGVADALGIAASMGSGILEANRTGGTVKRIHCGWAAHSGVMAAALAHAGITGPPTVLEGRFGFFRAWLDGTCDTEALLGGLGERWETLRTVYKPYPSNHFTHPAVDCALALRAEGLDPGDIASAELGLPAPTLRTVAEPRDEKVRPRTPYHAKFSGPFTVATALLGGGGLGVHLDDFTPETLGDPGRLALAARVTCFADDRASEIFPTAFAAVLRVRTRGGALLEKRVDSSRGGPGHPLSRAELLTKFRLNAERGTTPERARQLAHAVGSLPTAPDTRALFD
ncbi:MULTISPECIES: MmgE/PrpD family protein [Streptomyces]|uniref:MmgE/PrpD family protein n=1 Tax=Streptomyces tsukubensis (strain DSM 42081 / NBRC 108919 / NRRL 18488 / 9993) TaxID=1114943 RepID=I2NA29_STRT9|nr:MULTISPECIES: MmgE/PrpD family protein [Streptomyces]AZK97688.1 2-methylcitrate dehydratase [Streptomyces tsukubensis]EIF93876.1 MmgE/PrpD family protein [Streptomyces tsukubensis NRRL18488]MYS64355.1 MmgE/PrpD family protein [Streptomyces sp. SID5473]QKM66376.1 MmgE/PrpD family protein [Streptomyces tsukubensis NRRL18488]TAI45284.1 MmgE/PrpD family protein [Streptomyces tsukubensis]